MEELWYKNPGVLLKNLDEFIPKKEYNNLQKINSLARLSMYYTISILLLKLIINDIYFCYNSYSFN